MISFISALHDGSETTIRIEKTALMSTRSSNNVRTHPINIPSPQLIVIPLFQPMDGVSLCPTDMDCNKLNFPSIECDYNNSCIYGKPINTTCRAKSGVQCKDMSPFLREWTCRYCYQTEHWEHSCVQKGYCNSLNSFYRTNCTVNPDVVCMGHRTFQKNAKCNWTQGYKWHTALILSITLGGFGVDRFYLGHWQEGIGKLFSFGGLGIWTLIDVILVSLHYLGPADGSLYI